MKQEIKICLPVYKMTYSIVFVALLSLVRGISMIDEIGLSIEPYLALLVAVFCADIYMSEWNEKRGEIISIIPIRNRIKMVYRRLLIQTLFLWLIGAVGYFLFFWQQPHNYRGSSIIQEYGWYLFAIIVTIIFWSVLSMTITNLLHNQWAGIGCSIVLWLMLYSRWCEQLLGKYNVFSYTFRDLNQVGNMDWIYGKIIGIAVAIILLALLPRIMKKIKY